MTDRVKGFTVTLDKDYRIDDIQKVMDAIRMMKCVIDVAPVIVNGDDYINRMKIRNEFKDVIFNLYKDL